MKRVSFFLAAAFCVAVMGGMAQSQELMVEHFNYSTGQLTNASGGANVSGGNWVSFSGTGNFIPVSAGSLSYTNYLGPVGNKIDIVATTASAEDAYRQFTTQVAGTTYAAFLVNVTNTTLLPLAGSATGDYFAGLASSSSTTILDARVSIRTGSVAGTYQLGLRASATSTAAFSSTDLSPGITHLVVISYQIVAGAANDTVKMWIDPPLGGSEPAADFTQTSLGDVADVARFFVRQGSGSGVSTPNASIDTILVGTTWQSVTAIPTAANGAVSGRIVDVNGEPVEGALVSLSGGQTRKTITDANGNYHFNNVEANGFYTVVPTRANYQFSPSQRSFSLIGNKTDATFSGSFTDDIANPLDTAEYFVRQQYLDVLRREPDEAGFNYWSDQINACGGNAECTRSLRTGVAAAFFIEQEAQVTGSFIYNLYEGALGRRPAFGEYATDRQQVVGGADLEARKAAFAQSFVQRAEFADRYQGNAGGESFVDALLANLRQSTGVDLSSNRGNLITRYNAGANQTEGRSFVLRDITESAAVREANYNKAFVLTEYFSYLGRNPDPAGYNFWLNVLSDGDRGNYRGMVCSFITSTEYQRRFSGVVTHGNGECGP